MKLGNRWLGNPLLRVGVGLFVLAAAGATFLVINVGNAAPQVTTDKADYFSSETVHVTGSGFAAGTQYDIPVIRPDGSIVKGDGSFSLGWDSVTSNDTGSFAYNYQLDGIFGTYEVRVYLKPWSGNLSDAPLASTTFTDADIDFTQCKNDSDNNNTADPCSWTTGGLNSNNSIFAEGQAVPQRLFHKLTAPGAYELQFEYDFSKSNTYAYDFMTSGDGTKAPQSTSALLNACGGLPGFVSSSACSTMFGGASATSIDSDPFDSVSVAEASAGTRNVLAGCSGPGSCSGFDVVIQAHSPATTCYQNCGTSSVSFRVKVTAPAGTSNTTPTIVGLWFAGHLASQSAWGASPACGGSGCGASSISGAPFHLKYSCLQEPGSGSCGSVGNRDNQIAPGTVLQGSITIGKQTTPDGASQSFSFTCTSPLGSFSLADGGSQSFPGLTAGSYTCTETVPSGWVSPPNITCTGDTDGGTPSSSSSTSIAIDLDGGENIICTFNNTNIAPFQLLKDFSDNNTASVTVSLVCASGTVTAVDATASESDPADFTVSGYSGDPSCTATESPIPSGYSSSGTCTANLSAGSCTITNTFVTGTITVCKTTIPAGSGQVFNFTSSYAPGSFSLTGGTCNTSGPLGPGTYSASETVPPGWVLTPEPPNRCTNGSSSSAISLGPAQNVICTFENSGVGTVIINKTCNGGNDTFNFTGSGSGIPSSFSVTCAGGSGSQTFNNIPAGSKTVTESVPPPPSLWQFSSLNCTDPDSGTTTGGATASIDLDPGETVTCTFTNEKYGKIVIVKDAQPNDPNQDFSFSCTPVIGPFILDDDIDPTFSNTATFEVSPWTYNCAETVPSGWSLTSATCSDGSPPSAISLQPGETVTCTFVDELIVQPFTVNKDFSDNNPANVNVTLSCASGTVTTVDGTASEADPADFAVSGASGDPTCTATESPVPGYSSSGTCSAALSVGNCTIVNTVIVLPFKVSKDFSDNNPANVNVTLSCTSGAVTTVDGTASEVDPADFTVSGASGDPSCTATESPVPGYSSSGTCSAALSVGVCTIVNNLLPKTFVVNKDFSDNNTADVTVSLTCSSGVVTPDDPTASEADPANFTVSNFSAGTTCTAVEGGMPATYTWTNPAACQNVPLSTGACTLVNTRNDASFRVYKDFTDDNPQDVPVSLTCTSGTVVVVDGTASESDPADFTVQGIVAGTTCSASETAPFPYYQQSSNCNAVAVTTGGTSSCTIVNAIVPGGTPVPVGGIAGLIDDGGGQRPQANSGGNDGFNGTLIGAVVMLALVGTWTLRRGWFRR